MPSPPPSSEEINLSGAVDSVVFRNEENGFTIFEARVPGTPKAVKVLGTLPAVVEGECFEASGHWEKDPRFGRQFKASQIIPKPPHSLQAIEKYLGSGMIEGLGKSFAKRIVETFGKDTFHVIEHESQKLQRIEGVGKKRRQQIKDSWNEQKAVRDIMIFLHGQGLSTGRAKRIYKRYGDNAVNVLRGDPYRLIRDLPGVGFKTADDIARKMGQPAEAPRRVRAGVEYVLDLAEGQGHCALPHAELVSQAERTLAVDATLIESCLESQIANGRLIAEETGGDEKMFFRVPTHQAETTVATILGTFSKRPPQYPNLDPDEEIKRFERKNGFTLGEDQAEAVRAAMQNRLLVITGGPGVGKTTILNAVLQILGAKKVKPVLCAPTGRAAKRLNESTGRRASTIHRLLEFQPEGGFAKCSHDRLKGDLFVVDEASMIDIHLMAAFLDAIPDTAHIIFVGDVDQLPSVGPGTVLRDLIESAIMPVARLTQIYRQAEQSSIVRAAHAVNQGRRPVIDNAPESDFFFFERRSGEPIVSTLKQLITERIPNKFGFDSRRDIQVLTPMNRHDLGTVILNERLQDAMNPPQELKLEIERFGRLYRKGDKVIQIKNNYDKAVFNGDIGHIAEITTEPAKVIVHFDGVREVVYEPGDLDELHLAYAITIHKSQGSEFPAVIIPLAMQHYILLQRNLIYTGLTRGKELVILVGEKKALETAIRNQKSRKRWTGLCGRLKGGS